MKTQNTEIPKHNNIVSVTAVDAPSALKIARPQQPEPLDRDAERRRAFLRESIERKQRADSFYHSLKPEQQAQLLEWLQEDMSLVTIIDKVSAPPPKGFGVKVHLTSLRRLRAWWRGMDEVLRTEEILDTVHDMERHCDLSQQPRIQEAISQMLHEKAFELARAHPGSEVLGEVLSSITKLAALDHKREKLLLDRQKLFRSFTSDATKDHRVDLNIIPPTPPLTQINQAPAVQVETLPPANPRQISDESKPTIAPLAATCDLANASPRADQTVNQPSSANSALISPGEARLPPSFASLGQNPPQSPASELVAETPADTSPTTVVARPKIGRNDPCPCGSGRKYKKCCAKP